jgi:hypothetical protein
MLRWVGWSVYPWEWRVAVSPAMSYYPTRLSEETNTAVIAIFSLSQKQSSIKKQATTLKETTSL